MGTIPALTNWTLQNLLTDSALDTDIEAIRRELDGDPGYGVEAINLPATTARFRLSQQAEPAGRMMIDVPFLDITSSTTETAPFTIRAYAICPASARLARVAVAWHRLSIATNSTYLSMQVTVAGHPFYPGGQSFVRKDAGNKGGWLSVLQGTYDFRLLEAIGRPAIAAWQPIPIDLLFDFDGETFTMEGVVVKVELNVEHVRG